MLKMQSLKHFRRATGACQQGYFLKRTVISLVGLVQNISRFPPLLRTLNFIETAQPVADRLLFCFSICKSVKPCL